MLGIGTGVRYGFIARAKDELVGSGWCSKQIGGGRVEALLPADYIVFVWEVCHRPPSSPSGWSGGPPVMALRGLAHETVWYVTVAVKTELSTCTA
jgi:hypothetical protein